MKRIVFILLSTLCLGAIDSKFQRSFGPEIADLKIDTKIKTNVGRIGTIRDIEASCPGLTIFSCQSKILIQWEDGIGTSWLSVPLYTGREGDDNRASIFKKSKRNFEILDDVGKKE